MNPADIQPQMPQDASQPQPAPDNQPAPADAAPPAEALPHALLKYPAIQGLLAGMPVAVSDQISQFREKPLGKDVAKYSQQLQQAGLMFYKSLSGDTGVIFNALHVHPADIQAADKAGKLKQIAPDIDRIDHELGKAGKNHPILAMQTGAPQAPATPTPQAPPQSAQLPPPVKQNPASAQKKLMAARIMAASPGSPLSGPAPGSGRLLNSILKPVV